VRPGGGKRKMSSKPGVPDFSVDCIPRGKPWGLGRYGAECLGAGTTLPRAFDHGQTASSAAVLEFPVCREMSEPGLPFRPPLSLCGRAGKSDAADMSFTPGFAVPFS
jgi:hypothetical protein